MIACAKNVFYVYVFEWFWHEGVWIRAIEQIEKFIFIDDQVVEYTESEALKSFKSVIYVFFEIIDPLNAKLTN